MSETISKTFRQPWLMARPSFSGHEWDGTVVELGENTTRFKVGDRVAAEAHKGCGFCPYSHVSIPIYSDHTSFY